MAIPRRSYSNEPIPHNQKKIILLILISFSLSHGKEPSALAVETDIIPMLKSLYINDNDTLIKHMHPNLVKLLGGEEKLRTRFTKDFEYFKKLKVSFAHAKVLEVYNYQKTDKIECFCADVNLVLKLNTNLQ